jgi:V/A-type H+-transporting ATPase subunit E
MSQQNSSLDLEAKLIERTMGQRDEMIAKAEAESKTLIDNAEKEAQRLKSEADRQILNIVASVLRGVRDRIVGGVELDSRKQLMIAREQTLQQIYGEAEKNLKELTADKKEYHQILMKLIAEAVKAIGGEEFIISANDADLADLKKNHKKLETDIAKAVGAKVALKLDATPISAIGGVVVKNAEGTKVYHNTLEGRVEKARPKLNIELTKILEAE